MSDRWLFDGSPLADPEERQVVFAALDSFRQYRQDSHYNVTHRRRQNLYALPESQWKILAAPPIDLLEAFNAVDDALDHNADIADVILELGLSSFGLPANPEKGSLYNWQGAAKLSDLTKAHSTIRQFYRDWSSPGFTAEVEPMLNAVLEDLTDASLKPAGDSAKPLLLVPGAGLGRMLFSLSLAGYNVEGNEISYHQLLASNFILNATQQAEQYKLYPFASTFVNNKARANQLRDVLIPDIHPATAIMQRRNDGQQSGSGPGEMNMTAGDFVTSYGNATSRASFDGVVSIYFIDTAPNLIRYIETVRNCLKEGGVWVNVGPLLWHFDDHSVEDDRDTNANGNAEAGKKKGLLPSSHDNFFDSGIGEPGSFELSDEEIILLLKSMGFEVLKHNYLSANDGGYIQDPESMIQNRYQSSHWVARKTRGTADA